MLVKGATGVTMSSATTILFMHDKADQVLYGEFNYLHRVIGQNDGKMSIYYILFKNIQPV